MSKDFIVLDVSGLDLPQENEHLGSFIDQLVGDGQMPEQRVKTETIGEIIRWAGDKFGTSVDASSNWSLWPPIVLAKGRHCTFNLTPAADSITFMMMLTTQCQKLGLILIDPSGNNPYITLPNGGGLLD